jgi:hypothetical protein
MSQENVEIVLQGSKLSTDETPTRSSPLSVPTSNGRTPCFGRNMPGYTRAPGFPESELLARCGDRLGFDGLGDLDARLHGY